MTRDEKEQSNEKSAQQMRSKRQTMTQDEKEQSNDKRAQQMRSKRQTMTQDEKEQANEKSAQQMRSKRQTMTQDEKEQANDKRAQQMRSKRQTMTQEEKDTAKAEKVERSRKKRKDETDRKEELRADFSLDVFREGHNNFYRFEQSMETSVCQWHMNSGSESFRAVRKLGGEHPLSPDQLDGLLKEIKNEKLTTEEHNQLVREFLEEQGRGGFPGINHEVKGLEASKHTQDACILTCASCGIKDMERGKSALFKVVEVDALSPVLSFTEEEEAGHKDSKRLLMLPVDEKGTMKQFNVQRLRSFHKSNKTNKLFHLHPEFVHEARVDKSGDEVEHVFLCKSCHSHCFPGKGKKGQAPPRSIAAGVDFGDFNRIGLEAPNLMERKVIAKHRHFHSMIKVQPNDAVGARSDFTCSKTRCHSILFRHDAADVAALDTLVKSSNGSPNKRSGKTSHPMTLWLEKKKTAHFSGNSLFLEPMDFPT